MIRCPECKKLVDENLKVCNVCGYPFTGGEENVETKRCPECGADIEATEETCNVCGYPFKEEQLADESIPVVIEETQISENFSEEVSEISEQDIQPNNIQGETSDEKERGDRTDEILENVEETATENLEPFTHAANEINDAEDTENIGQEDKTETIQKNKSEEKTYTYVADAENISKRKIYLNKKAITIAGSVAAVILIGVLTFIFTSDMRAYAKAKDLMENGKYTEAVSRFKELDGYKESNQLIQECNYRYGLKEIDSGNYTNAMKILEMAGTGKEVEEAKNKCRYQEALVFAEEKKYAEAIEILSNLDYEDSQEKLMEVKYIYAKEYIDSGDNTAAITLLSNLNYKDSQALVNQCRYNIGKELYDQELYAEALPYLRDSDYEDSQALVENINNNPYSLDKFVERYNSMVDILKATNNITVSKIRSDMFKGSALTLSSGAKISFNNGDSGKNYKNKITNFNYYIPDSRKASGNLLAAEAYATFAGFAPNSTYESVGDILTEITTGSGKTSVDGIEYVSYSFAELIIFKGDMQE